MRQVNIRAVKMGWNPRVNPAHHGFGSGWVEIFYIFQYWLIFDPTHVKPDSLGLNPWWAGLAHQPADQRVTQLFFIFFIKLGFTFGW